MQYWLASSLLAVTLLFAPFHPECHASPADVRNENAVYGVVFYYASAPAANPEETVRALAKELLPTVPIVGVKDDLPAPPFILFHEEQAPLKEYPVPAPEYFETASRGLTKEDIATIGKTEQATSLVLVMPNREAWTMGRKFTELAARFADLTRAYIWDSATRECFTRETWKKTRLAPWPDGELPDVNQHVTAHAYQPNDDSAYIRIITLGMEKFALPDVVVERTSGSDLKQSGRLINLICQSIAENPLVDKNKAVFRVDALKCEPLKKDMTSSFYKNATGEVTLSLLAGTAQKGDPENPLLQVSFEFAEGNSEDEKRVAALSALWGATDSVKGVKHNEAILAASEAARKKLPELQVQFTNGFPPGTRLLVKAPFERDDEGNEWMWVEVMAWPEKGKIEGLLMNDPFYIKKLKAGARVQLSQEDIFDYLLRFADGTVEGNETSKLIEQQEGAVETR